MATKAVKPNFQIVFENEEIINKIEEGKSMILKIYRTGYILKVYAGEMVDLRRREGRKEITMATGEVMNVAPVMYQNISKKAIEYKTHYHNEHYFFKIVIRLAKIKGE